MTLVDNGHEWIVLHEGRTSLRVRVEKDGGNTFLCDLETTGDPSALLFLVSKAKERGDLHLVVDEDNPKRDKLIRFYERFGASRCATVLKV